MLTLSQVSVAISTETSPQKSKRGRGLNSVVLSLISSENVTEATLTSYFQQDVSSKLSYV